MAKVISAYAKGLLPRFKKLSEAGVSLNTIFRDAEVSRSNWSRWKSGETSPTMTTHDRLMKTIESYEAKVAKKAVKKHVVTADDI